MLAELFLTAVSLLPVQTCGEHVPANTRLVGPLTIQQTPECTQAALFVDGPNVQIVGVRFIGNANEAPFREFAHLVEARNATGLTVTGNIFERINGDGLLVWSGDNLSVLGNSFIGASDGDYRNWVSFVGGTRGALVYGNTFWTPTVRHDMPGGVDLEPDASGATISDITIERNIFITKVQSRAPIQIWTDPWLRDGSAFVERVTTPRNIMVGPFQSLVGGQVVVPASKR